MRIEEILLKTAMDDLKAAQLLYDKKLYQQSLFSFQQASEKSNRSFFIFAKLYTPEQARNHSHNQLKIHKQTLDKRLENLEPLQKDPIVREISGQFSEFTSQISDEHISGLRQRRNLFENISKLGKLDILNVDRSQLRDLLNSLYEYQKILIDGVLTPLEYETVFEEKKAGLLAFYDRIAVQYPEKKKEINEQKEICLTPEFKDLMFLGVRYVIYDLKIHSVYSSIAMLTNSLENIRYCEVENPKLWNKELNKSNAYIKYQPHFMKQLNYAQKLHRKFMTFHYSNHPQEMISYVYGEMGIKLSDNDSNSIFGL